MTRKFFISHRSSDKASALDLKRKLNEFSVAKAWVDNFELEAGDSLSKIQDSIKECDVLLVLWTEETNLSDWVKKEIELGQNYDLRIINCVIHRSLFQQPYVRNTVCIDYSLEELGFGHLCLKEIAPLLFPGPDGDEAIRLYRGYVKSVIQELHSEDGVWDNEKY